MILAQTQLRGLQCEQRDTEDILESSVKFSILLTVSLYNDTKYLRNADNSSVFFTVLSSLPGGQNTRTILSVFSSVTMEMSQKSM